MEDIIINDGYILETGAALMAEAWEIENTLSVYIRLLRELKERGFMEGETANAVSAFTDIVEKLRNKFADCGEGADTACDNFISKMEDADKGLYEGI